MIGRAALLIALMLAGPAAAQTYKAPRNALGQPDLEGVWTEDSMTHLQRPKEFATLTPTPAEAAAYEGQRHARYAKGIAPTAADAPAPDAGPVADESPQWVDPPTRLARVRGQIRSSYIVEPADGRLPYTAASKAASEQALKNEEVYDDPEGRPFDERCILGGGGGVAAPILNRDLVKIVQSRDAVLLYGEQNHEARIVRLSRRHLPASVRPWMGDSIGWWDGDTLVVETTNLNPSDRWRWTAGDWIPLSENTRITERFTRTAPGEITYAFTVDDPSVYASRWRAEIAWRTTSRPMFEFACHEGNYALTNILRGGRIQDAQKPVAVGTP
jgi:hypothetical protein